MSDAEIKAAVVTKVIDYLRDSKENNRILDKVETSPDLIGTLLDDAFEEFNVEPPTSSFTLSDLPQSLLRNLVVIEVLKSAGIWYTRNSMPYSSGGVSIQDFEGKDRSYISWCTSIDNNVQRIKKAMKVKANIESIL